MTSPRLIFTLFAASIAATAGGLRAEYDVQPRFMSMLPPGTTVDERPAPPWSHLIIKSHPRCTHGDVDRVARSNIELASLLSTSLMAVVQPVGDPNNRRYQLRTIAGGVSKNINGRDTIIDPGSQKRLGARLSFLQSMVLKEFHRQQRTVIIIARSSSFMLFDTPIVVRRGNRNEAMVLRYAALLDERSGDLDTFCWLIRKSKDEYLGVEGEIHQLKDGLVINCDLWVDASEYSFGIPSKKAYACVAIPPAQTRFEIPPKAGALIGKRRVSAEESRQIHQWLRGCARMALLQNPNRRRP